MNPARSGAQSYWSAFTLVEIMIVVAIIGVLVVLVLPSFVKARTKSQTEKCVQNQRLIFQGVERYEMDTGRSLYASRNRGNSIRLTLTTNGYVNLSAAFECPNSGDNNNRDYRLYYADSSTFTNVYCTIKPTLHVLQ